MDVEEVKRRAHERAVSLEGQPAERVETFRADATTFFGRVPEPPLYRRREDPTRQAAAALLPEGEALLARAERLGDAVATYRGVLEGYLEVLCLTADGRVEAAAGVWHDATRAEREATAMDRLWRRTDEKRPPVFDSHTRVSRFDPRAEPVVQVKLACPWCQKPGDFSLPPRAGMQRLGCVHCAQDFWVYLAETRAVEVTELKGARRRYVFRVEDLSGSHTRVEFEDVGQDALTVGRRDLLAFLYAPAAVLRGVLNLNSSRVLWLPAPGPCFVATAALGADAPELVVLRRFRDEVLVRGRPGRAFVGWYYREGPTLARLVKRHRTLGHLTRWGVRGAARILERTLS